MTGRRLLPETAQALALLRVWIFGVWLVQVVLEPLADLAWLPREIFTAPGLLAFLPDGFWRFGLSASGLLALKLALIMTLAGAAAGILGRPCAVLATLLLVYYQGLLRGFGQINHAELPALYGAALLTLAPAWDAWVLSGTARAPRDPRRYAAGFLLVMLALVFTYVFVGVNRVVHGRDVFDAVSMPHWILLTSFRDTAPTPGLGRFVNDAPFSRELATLGFLAVSGLELAAPLALFSLRFRRLFVPAMAVFHAVTWVVLRIEFWGSLVLLPAFLDWDRLALRLENGSRRLRRRTRVD